MYSHIVLFFLKDSGETAQRMKFAIYPQSRLKKNPTEKCNPFSSLCSESPLLGGSHAKAAERDGRDTILTKSGDFPAVVLTPRPQPWDTEDLQLYKLPV